MRRACSSLPPPPACGERSRAKRAGEGDPPRPEYLESPPHPDPLPASGEREQTEFAARPDSNSPKSDLISRDDLALAAMHGGRRRHAARPPPQQDRGPPPLERGTPAAARDRRRDADRAEPLERLAQIAVGPGAARRAPPDARASRAGGHRPCEDAGADAASDSHQVNGKLLSR